MSGENFNPHVSTGVAPKAYLDQMMAEPFKPFTFSPAGAAVYQLGPFGTAAKKLKQWKLNRSPTAPAMNANAHFLAALVGADGFHHPHRACRRPRPHHHPAPRT